MQNRCLGNEDKVSKWDCPVCYQLPKGNIFQCANGHALCDQCSARISECPTCRSPGVNIRCRLAENLLDDINFPCSWKEQGCTEILKRCNIAAHEDQCSYKPNAIKLCSLFWRSKSCKYQIDPNMLRDPVNRKDFIDHLTTYHNYTFSADKQYGKQKNLKLKSLQIKTFDPKFFEIVDSSSANITGPLFFHLPLVDFRKTDTKITWVLVHLTPETVPVTMKFTINANQKSTVSSKWGCESVAALSWTAKSMSALDYIDLIDKLKFQEEKLTYPFWLNISFLEDYYVNEKGSLKVECFMEKNS